MFRQVVSYFRRFYFSISFAIVIVLLSSENLVRWVSEFFLKIIKVDVSPLLLFFTNNISDIIVIFLVTLFVDLRLSNSSLLVSTNNSKSLKEFIEYLKAQVEPFAQISYQLKKVYGDDVDGLTKILTTKKSIHRDVKVYIDMVESERSKDLFNYSQKVEFLSRSNSLVVAIITDSSLQDNVFSIMEVDDLVCVANTDSVYGDIRAYADQVSVVFSFKDKNGKLCETKVELEDIHADRVAEFYRSAGESPREGAYFFEAQFHDGQVHEWVGVRIVYPPLEFSKSNPFVYWIADRPLYLKSIEINATRFCSEKVSNIKVTSFLHAYSGNKNFGAVLAHKEPIWIAVDSWCTYGQGIIITWSKPSLGSDAQVEKVLN